MPLTHDRESNTLSLVSHQGKTTINAEPFYLQLCPFCEEVLRAYFLWPEPLNVSGYGPPRHHLSYDGTHCEGYQTVVQRSHRCVHGEAFHAVSLAFSLERIVRDRLAYRPRARDGELDQLSEVASRIAAGEVDPAPFTLVREIVQGRDYFLALRYGAITEATVPPDGDAPDHRRALMFWLAKVAPDLATTIKCHLG